MLLGRNLIRFLERDAIGIRYTASRITTPFLASLRPYSTRTSSLTGHTGDNLLEDALHQFKDSLSFAASLEQDPIANLRFSEAARGQTVTLHGYLGETRTTSKNLSFTEFYGPELDTTIQLVSVTKILGHDKHDLLRRKKAYTPAVIQGLVKAKSVPTDAERAGNRIPNEIEIHDAQFLNDFPAGIHVSDNNGPDQRHLQLKSSNKLRTALQIRSQIYHTVCAELIDQGYQHIETPLLFKSTSEGAREFLVPTRRDGLAYALPQSPQQYKQLLMSAGIPKYFQMARCFRDEDMRADRQPEFTQLDLERSFASGKDIMHDVEALVKTVLAKISPLYKEVVLQMPQDSAFQILSYHEAMSKYGSDKPDLRLNYSIKQIDYLLPADLISKISPLNQPAVDISIFRAADSTGPQASRMREFIAAFLDSPDAAVYHQNPHGGPGISIYDSQKPLSGLQSFGFEAAEVVEETFEPEEGDLIILQARPNEDFSGGSTALGKLMIDLNKAAVEQKLKTLPAELRFLWVVDFPLFTPASAGDTRDTTTTKFLSTHHPFTSPKTAEDVDLLFTNPQNVIADHYDLVLNGVEVGGGSRRIHNAAVQRFVMEQVLKMPAEKVEEFSHLLEALRAGCPPHAGFALGFDRFVAVLLGHDSVRDVIAFPKWGKGDDPLVKAPAKVSAGDWNVYKLEPRI